MPKNRVDTSPTVREEQIDYEIKGGSQMNICSVTIEKLDVPYLNS